VILIDTAPLVALCDARDSKHRIAVRHLESLAANDFLVCDAVLTETCFHLPYRSQRQRFRALLDDLSVQPPPIAHERDFWFEVLDWLIKYADHEPDWADGCLAVLSGRDKDLKVWTYDREFRTTWRRPNGTAIPLAVR
jgi:predicted nucleic acid-binding protein